jgi:phage baseplate assembly protein gpV
MPIGHGFNFTDYVGVGSYLLGRQEDGTLLSYKMANGRLTGKTQAGTGFNFTDYIGVGSYLLGRQEDGTLLSYKMANGRLTGKTQAGTGFNFTDYIGVGSYLLGRQEDGTLLSYKMANGRLTGKTQAGTGFNFTDYIGVGSYLLGRQEDGTLLSYKMANGRLTGKTQAGTGFNFTDYVGVGSYLLGRDQEAELLAYKLSNGSLRQILSPIFEEYFWNEYRRYVQSHTWVKVWPNGHWQVTTKFSNGDREAPRSMVVGVRVLDSNGDILFKSLHEETRLMPSIYGQANESTRDLFGKISQDEASKIDKAEARFSETTTQMLKEFLDL